ncbi:MAG: hypothetical protein E6J84_06305 [Deltaproteobacteria bacterium]|nr:MAG: hypothetical protein E6J84_06305 [Deltaproteobacteria bacterium]
MRGPRCRSPPASSGCRSGRGSASATARERRSCARCSGSTCEGPRRPGAVDGGGLLLGAVAAAL